MVFMAAANEEIKPNEAKKVVPLHTWMLISHLKLSYNLLRRQDGTLRRELAEFLDRKAVANIVPVDGVYSFDVVNRTTGLFNRVYKPAPLDHGSLHRLATGILDFESPLSSSEIVPVIVFFHGGSFTHSSANSAIYDTFCRRLTRDVQGVVVSVNYRRSPEHRYPSAYEDGWEALQWVCSRSWLVSGKVPKVYVYLSGDSSGGNIAHNVAHQAAISGVEVLGNVLLHPLFGGEKRTESERRLDGKYFVKLEDRDWYWRAFLPEGENRDHPACNVFGPRGCDLAGIKFSKTLVVIAGLDLVQDWQWEYVEGLKRFGHDVKVLFLEKASIGFYFFPNNEHFCKLMEEMKRFLKG
ncbi:putative carboxylesterase [Helianthus annuus]|nr:putative carboxylesterase [Helianthus annuus]KAJ0955495.1 putative carboxylesterase [Helianthus annuus]